MHASTDRMVFALGSVCFQRHKFREAKELFERSLKTPAEFRGLSEDKLFLCMAAACQELGEVENARAYLRRHLAAGGSGDSLRDILMSRMNDTPTPPVSSRDRDASKRKMAEKSAGGRKIGRNEQCPCGSGKKYKYCCLRRTR
jgi:hypothetical protein